jgi:hypothetical protein
MKLLIYLSSSFLLLTLSASAARKDSSETSNNLSLVRKVTTEPAIGLNPYPTSDLVFSNLVQWNMKKHLSIVSHTSYAFNNAFLRVNNYIQTNYNYSLSQKFGIGTSLYSKRSSHTFSLMAGIKYDSFKETLENPEFEKVSATESFISPDVGLMYSLKVGKKKYFFSFRTFIPLYPYPFKSTDVYSMDGNMANLSLEFGFGIRLK